MYGANVRLACAKSEIARLSLSARHAIEYGCFTHIGNPNNTALQTHIN
jgi:hypothetical protein